MGVEYPATSAVLDGGSTNLKDDYMEVSDIFPAGIYRVQVTVEASTPYDYYTFELFDDEGTRLGYSKVGGNLRQTNLLFLVEGQVAVLSIKVPGSFAASGIAAGTAGLYVMEAGQGINVLAPYTANRAVAVIDTAISAVVAERAKLGAYQNRLEHTVAALGAAAENLTAATSRLRDLDVAEEAMAFARQQILSRAGAAVLAQANVLPQAVLRLLR